MKPLRFGRSFVFVVFVAVALGCGGKSTDQLARELTDDHNKVRREAAQVLGDMGPAAKGAVPNLADSLGDKDAKLRRLSAKSLGRVGKDAKESIPKLIGSLKESAAKA